jgi:hypothetical protein
MVRYNSFAKDPYRDAVFRATAYSLDRLAFAVGTGGRLHPPRGVSLPRRHIYNMAFEQNGRLPMDTTLPIATWYAYRAGSPITCDALATARSVPFAEVLYVRLGEGPSREELRAMGKSTHDILPDPTQP